jgi:DNA repair exonuclease SbcCD nuclease subunit
MEMDGVLYVPYTSDPNLFIDTCSRSSAKTVFCHQEFNGARYDNGFFTPHGADPSKILQNIISGHIHTPQSFGNVWYPGSPRWRTISDANQQRGLWLLTIKGGEVTSKTSVPTDDICRRIWAISVSKGDAPNPSGWNKKDDYRLTIEGDPEFVSDMGAYYKEAAPWVKIRTIIQDTTVKVRESEGIPNAFRKYAVGFVPKNGTKPEDLALMAMERIYGQA